MCVCVGGYMCLYLFLEEGFNSFCHILKRVHNPQRIKILN